MRDATDEELHALKDAPIVQLALACRDVVDAADEIRENDLMWDQAIEDTVARQSRIRSRDSVEAVVNTFLKRISHYGNLARPPTEDDESEAESGEASSRYTSVERNDEDAEEIVAVGG